MITPHRSEARGHAEHGWLDTYYTFSFADWFDPAHLGFRTLRVLNQDLIAPGTGFPAHGHRDMEIVTWVLEGAVEHEDSLRNRHVVHPGEVQRMSAGTGVRHSERNPSRTERLHLLQIWIEPASPGATPSYEQRAFPADRLQGKLCKIAAHDPRDGAVRLHQDADILAARLAPRDLVEHRLREGRGAWLHVARGAVAVQGVRLQAGDGAAIEDEPALRIEGLAPSEILLLDLR